MVRIKTGSDPLSRAAIRQIVWLSVAGISGFVALMAVLSWASSHTGSGVDSFSGIDYQKGAGTLVVEDEPPQLDSTRMTDAISGRILGHVMEGLLRYDEKNRLVGGIAERWEIRSDGATFWLRNNALWSDGKPVTANDFVFAWQT